MTYLETTGVPLYSFGSLYGQRGRGTHFEMFLYITEQLVRKDNFPMVKTIAMRSSFLT